MAAGLSQQVTATYARNHFKEINDRAIREGMCIIVRKSKPISVILSMVEFEKMMKKYDAWNKFKEESFRKDISKLNLENGRFSKFVGAWKNPYPGLSSVEIAKKWTDYVDWYKHYS